MHAGLTSQLWDLEHTMAAPLLSRFAFPWDALGALAEFIREAGRALPAEEYDSPAPDVYIAHTASVAHSASITGPCIIGPDTEVRHCAFIRGGVLVGRGAVVGNSVELKNCILFDGAQVPHFNYVGDSILGHGAHLGAGAVTSNVKSDKSPVVVRLPERDVASGRKKLGAMVGDLAEVGCNAVLCPGTVLGRHSTVYPGVCVRGTVPAGCILKAAGVVVEKNALRTDGGES